MTKTLNGVVSSVKMNKAVIVEITRRIAHPKYGKLLKRSKKFAVALQGHTVNVGDSVTIIETKPISKTIHHIIDKVHGKKEGKE